jgi:DNA-nicking Smr family endonuclease
MGENGGKRRDREADRALFEQAVARLDRMPPDKAGLPAPGTGRGGAAASGRRARFSRRLARGEALPETRIDLHGLDRDTAAARLRSFLSAAERGVEVVLVVHGRGLGILAATVVTELDRHPRVVEHLEAPPQLGGAGVRLVRLRRPAAGP